MAGLGVVILVPAGLTSNDTVGIDLALPFTHSPIYSDKFEA